MTLKLTMEHTIGCQWPEGCSCGANEINALRQQLADATQRADILQQRFENRGVAIADYAYALGDPEQDVDKLMLVGSVFASQVRKDRDAARDRIAELEGLLRERPEDVADLNYIGSGEHVAVETEAYTAWSAKVDAALAPSPTAKGDTACKPLCDGAAHAADCAWAKFNRQPDAERPSDGEVESVAKMFDGIAGWPAKADVVRRLLAHTKRQEERGDNLADLVARMQDERTQLRERAEAAETDRDNWQRTSDILLNKLDAAERRVAELQGHLLDEMREHRLGAGARISDLERQLAAEKTRVTERSSLDYEALRNYQAVIQERDQLRAQLAKQDEGERQPTEPLTQYQKELAQLTAMFPDGCPVCPSKLPPDPRDGRCGMCGAVLVERRVLSGAGSEGSK